MQPFGRNRYGPKIGGLCPFAGGGAGSPSNTKSPWQRPSSIPSGILMYFICVCRKLHCKSSAMYNFNLIFYYMSYVDPIRRDPTRPLVNFQTRPDPTRPDSTVGRVKNRATLGSLEMQDAKKSPKIRHLATVNSIAIKRNFRLEQHRFIFCSMSLFSILTLLSIHPYTPLSIPCSVIGSHVLLFFPSFLFPVFLPASPSLLSSLPPSIMKGCCQAQLPSDAKCQES